jgi:hypothetical protein
MAPDFAVAGATDRPRLPGATLAVALALRFSQPLVPA